jgi:site-specific DNA recombinase
VVVRAIRSSPQTVRAINAIVSLTLGARIVAEFQDLDESGGSIDRPGVRKAISMVDTGQVDGIVCAYLDRWARTMEAPEMIERWTKHGKTFISAHDRFDANTSTGRFALGMMLLVAKYYRDRVTETWDASARGVYVTVPFGYRRAGNKRGAQLLPETGKAAIVRRIFTERAQGVGISVIADGLNSDGIPSPRRGRWTRHAVRALIRVRADMGEASRGEYVHENAHAATVTRDE